MNSRMIGGILLVAGTTIGAGMLALPVLTGSAGMFWSSLLFIGYWMISVFTALLMLEANLWFPENVNLITMTRLTLGRAGEAVAWVVYLLLLYALTAAYLAGSGPLIAEVIHSLFGWQIAPWLQPLPVLVIFGTFVYHGTHWVDYLNRFMMIAMVLLFGGLLTITFPHISGALLAHSEPSHLWMALPVIVTSFGFHIIIPSLKTYLKGDVKALKKVIYIGSAVPLVVYILWELVILGIVPAEGSPSLQEALVRGESATLPLMAILKNPYISLLARFFSLFAIITSFLGVSLSLSDFLVDGLNIKKTRWGRLGALVLTFIPPLAFVWFYPNGFIAALQYAGIFISILLGILPICMVWRGRPKFEADALYRAPGGTFIFSVATLFFLWVIGLVIFQSF